jgi:glycosyltransferase involved in cell wall biosynthesis
MKILHVSHTDQAGGRFTGFYMGQYAKDCDIQMLVWEKTSELTNVHQINYSRNRTMVQKCLNNVAEKLTIEDFSGLSGRFIQKLECFKNADIVHFHLIHNGNFFSPLSFSKLSKLKPIVWTIHDPWAMTGDCIYPFECDKWQSGCKISCPHPREDRPLAKISPRYKYKLKTQAYKSADLNLIVASSWMEQMVKKSPLLNKFPLYKIPFGIDESLFYDRNKAECRKRLGIEAGTNVIAFRDVGLEIDRFKGLKYLKEALQIYSPQGPTTLLILQDGRGFMDLADKYNIKRTGWIDGEDLAAAYGAADIFLMPSIQEAFGLSAVEAMACGTPVVCFTGTSLPDVIEAPRGGIAVPIADSKELALAISQLLTDKTLLDKVSQQARQIVLEKYRITQYIDSHLDLYTKLIAEHAKK